MKKSSITCVFESNQAINVTIEYYGERHQYKIPELAFFNFYCNYSEANCILKTYEEMLCDVDLLEDFIITYLKQTNNGEAKKGVQLHN